MRRGYNGDGDRRRADGDRVHTPLPRAAAAKTYPQAVNILVDTLVDKHRPWGITGGILWTPKRILKCFVESPCALQGGGSRNSFTT
jgi:hypothetical protein